MKKFFKILGIVIGCLILIVLVGFFTFLEWPQIIINRSNVAWVLNHSEKMAGEKVKWSELEVSVKSLSFTQKRIFVHLGPGCASSSNAFGSQDLCFARADVGFAYTFSHVVPQLTELGPVRVDHADARIIVVKSKPFKIPAIVNHAKIEPIRVDVDHFFYRTVTGKTAAGRTGAGAMTGSAHVRSSGPTVRAVAGIEMISGGKKTGDLTAQIWMKTRSDQMQGPWDYRIQAKYANPMENALVRTRGVVQPSGISGDLNLDARFGSKGVPKFLRSLLVSKPKLAIVSHQCRYDFARKHGGEFNLSCPIGVATPKEQSLLTIEAHLLASYPYNANTPVRGTIQVIPSPVLWGSIHTGGQVRTQIDLVPAELPKFRRLDSQTDLTVAVPEFQKLVHDLAKTPLAVPAPFHVLRGNAGSVFRLSLKGRGGGLSGAGELSFDSNLASPRKAQSLKVSGSGKLGMQAPANPALPIRASVQLDLLLADVRLALPKLGPGAIPQLFPDTRLSAGKKAPEPEKKTGRPIELKYEARVHTLPEHPVILISNLTSRPVPIDLDLSSSTRRQLFGDINIRDIPLKVAGVRAKIGTVKLHADTASKVGTLTGFVVLGGQGLNKKRVPIPATQAAGQAAGQKAATRIPPQFSVPVVRIVSSVLLGVPLDLVSAQPETLPSAKGAERRAEAGPPALLQLRKRY